MKRILACLALMLFFTDCDETWGDDAKMSYVVEIAENPDGNCVYGFSDKVGGTKQKAIVMACGLYKIGEGIFTEQD